MEFPIPEVSAVARPPLARVAHALRASARRPADGPDADHDLLARFVRDRDEAAFCALVARHAKTVLTACRQVLSDPADVDDAFQATFLVLVRRAKAVDATTPLGGWLFAVAHRVAVRCRADRSRRRAREAEAARRKRTEADPPDLTWREAAAVLHDELNALPDKYRLPLLLCCVRGLTRDEAAEQLGATVGAVRGQLERGRALLERRLTRRGVALSAGLLAALVGGSRAADGPPVELIDAAARAGGGHAPAAVAALAHGAFPMTTLKTVVLPVVLALGLVGAGLGLGPRHRAATADEKPAPKMERPAAKADAKGEARKPAAPERTITGKVVGPDGRPVQADLHLVRVEGKPESLGKTKPDGTFSVTVRLADPGAWLVAAADGHGFDFMTPAVNTPAGVTFKLTKDQPIRGRVIDPQGMPAAGVTVRVRVVSEFGDGTVQPFLDEWKKRTHFRQEGAPAERTMSVREGGWRSATTDADGRFELRGLGAERLVHLTAAGGGRATTDLFVVTRAGFDPKPFNDVTLGLRPSGGEQLSWSFNPILSAPDATFAVEPEKLIRGTVTDARTGAARPGARVSVRQDDGLREYTLRATSDAHGQYVVRGARKWRSYTVTTAMDPEHGYLPSAVDAADTSGYEPVVVDVGCVKGVIVTGTLYDKGTGKPVAGYVDTEVLSGNDFAQRHPALGRHPQFERQFTKADGKYRRVIPPGPVLLAAGITTGPRVDEYKPAKPDPKYPGLFHNQFGALGYYGPGGLMGFVNGHWCKVIDARETDAVLTQDVEFERGAVRKVKVTDQAGKPVKGVHATGFHHISFMSAMPVGDADAVTVLNVEPNQDRLVAAIHREKRLVGALVFRDTDPAPTLVLGPGGTVTGRVLDENGRPRAGISVSLSFDRREVAELYGRFEYRPPAVTAADGTFALDTVLPGYEFRLQFIKGQTRYGPGYDKAPKHTIARHGEALDLGELKLEPAQTDGGE